MSKRVLKRREQIREMLAEFRSAGCQLCGETEPCCIQAHHRDPTQKRFCVKTSLAQSKLPISQIAAELDKCLPVCANCHCRIHAGIAECPS